MIKLNLLDDGKSIEFQATIKVCRGLYIADTKSSFINCKILGQVFEGDKNPLLVQHKISKRARWVFHSTYMWDAIENCPSVNQYIFMPSVDEVEFEAYMNEKNFPEMIREQLRQSLKLSQISSSLG